MDKDKYFLLYRGELDERLDPFFYKPIFKKAILKLPNRKKISQIALSVVHPPEYPRTYSETGYQLIRSQNVRPTGIEIQSNPVYFSKDLLKNKKIIKPSLGDLLIVRSGVNAGDAAVIEAEYGDSIIGADTLLAKFQSDVKPKFLQVFFWTSLGKLLLSRHITGATNGHISPHSFNKIEVPIISDTKQELAIKTFENALEKKLQNEQKVTELLNGIDSYLLGELKIILPQPQENTIENRMFQTNWQKVTGNRFDPKKYSKQSEYLIASINNSPLRKVPLKALLTHSVAGDWGIGENENANEQYFQRCLVIRATEFDNNYNLNVENSRAKYRMISKAKLKKLDIRENDFLLEKSGGSPDQPVGRIAIVEKELLQTNTICFSNFIQKFRINKTEILPEYLFCFLKTIHNIKLTDVMQSQTSGIRNLIMREYWNQQIVLPDKPKQREIANMVYNMRTKAKQTELETVAIFAQAKKEIESQILM